MSYFDFFPNWIPYKSDLDTVVSMIKNSSLIFVIGNGGSESIASHVVTDLVLAGYPAQSLTCSSVITALSNDFGYEQVYSKQIINYKNIPNAMLLAISSSGNSENIFRAVTCAKSCKFDVVTFSGFDTNNRIRTIGNVNVHIDQCDYGVVETGHMILLHYVINVLRGFE